VAKYSAAHYFLEGLVDLGVDYIFANLGTDHVSIIEELARWDKEGRKHPEDRKSTRLNSSHQPQSRMPSSA